MSDKETWLSSKETKKILKVSDCRLSHMRKEGELVFMKKGNAFLYSLQHIKNSGINKKNNS